MLPTRRIDYEVVKVHGFGVHGPAVHGVLAHLIIEDVHAVRLGESCLADSEGEHSIHNAATVYVPDVDLPIMLVQGESQQVCVLPNRKVRRLDSVLREVHHEIREQHPNGIVDQVNGTRSYCSRRAIVPCPNVLLQEVNPCGSELFQAFGSTLYRLLKLLRLDVIQDTHT